MSDNIKHNISQNIASLRRLSNMTQADLAEKLNYSDKAVSKWESGASVPDITVLYEIAQLFGVTVDYLLSTEHKLPVKQMVRETVLARKHLIITSMSVVLCWLIFTIAFVALSVAGVCPPFPLWLLFIWCIPVSSIVALVLNSIWGKRKINFIIISILVWSILASVYLALLQYNLWLIFVIGIPGQIIICLWAGIKKTGDKK